MKFKLPRPYFSHTVIELCIREMKKQKFHPAKMTPKMLKDFHKICQIIRKKGILHNLVLKKLPDPMGWGVFLNPKAKPILRGTLLGSYGGCVEILPMNLPDNAAYAFAPFECFHLLKDEQKEVDPKRKHHARRQYVLNIDAEKIGNFTRFVNHSEKPNIEARIYEVPENKLGLQYAPLEVIYFAKRKILPGEQILVSYEDEEASYWGVLNIKPVPLFARTFLLDKNMNLVDTRKKSKK